MPDEQMLCGAEGCNFLGRLFEVIKDGNTVTRSRCDKCAAKLRAHGYSVKLAQTKKWDLTSTNSLQAAAGWWRKNANATLVLVIRNDDAVVAVADGMTPQEVPIAINARLSDALQLLDSAQRTKRERELHRQIQSGTNPEERRYA